MENVALNRQTRHPASAGSFETHLYSYPEFPRIVSHIHTRFAIMGFAHNVEVIPPAALRKSCQDFPIVKRLLAVASSSKRMLPPGGVLRTDPTCMHPEVLENEEEEKEEGEEFDGSDGDSVCTVPWRIISIAPPIPKRRRDSEDSDDDDAPPTKSRRQGERGGIPEAYGVRDRVLIFLARKCLFCRRESLFSLSQHKVLCRTTNYLFAIQTLNSRRATRIIATHQIIATLDFKLSQHATSGSRYIRLKFSQHGVSTYHNLRVSIIATFEPYRETCCQISHRNTH
jgi:hypothetical protein